MAQRSFQKPESARMPARYFVPLCEILEARGVDVNAVLRAARIGPTQIQGPNASITVRQCEALVEEATRASGCDNLGFQLGRRIKLSNHEILGYGMLTSATLDAAIALAARYCRLMTPWIQLRYQRGPKTSELHFQPAMPMGTQALNFLLEMVVISAHEQLKSQALGSLTPYEVFVSYPEPAHARDYRELRPARFHFGVERFPGARMVLDSEVVAQPLAMADRNALKMAEERCAELMRATTQSAGMTDWVTMMLRESHEGVPTLAELARLLNQSSRTLDRHLAREGCRFLALSKRIRHEKACELLESGLSSTQVAYQVGYRDSANFTRAFRRESGKTPREFLRGRVTAGGEPRN